MWIYKRIHTNTNIQMHKYKHTRPMHNHTPVCIFVYVFVFYAFFYMHVLMILMCMHTFLYANMCILVCWYLYICVYMGVNVYRHKLYTSVYMSVIEFICMCSIINISFGD